MHVICAYCHKAMEEKPPFDNRSTSHSICSECLEYYRDQWLGVDLNGYLNRFPFPTVVVDERARVMALNQRMQEFLGAPEEEVVGALAGDVMECQFARLPDGCGQTVHCVGCAFRLNVNTVHQTGETIVNMPAYFNRDGRRLNLVVSMYQDGPGVRVVIEQAEEVADL